MTDDTESRCENSLPGADAAPPKTIPDELLADYTLNGKIPVDSWYFDDRRASPVHNTRAMYREAFCRLEKRTFDYYGNEMNAFYDAVDDYPLQGKNVLVWGLAGCNCEALAVWAGAEKVYVVDYNKPVCEHESIVVVSHEELNELSMRFDYAISYSSFEHDGLGRYGDPLLPYADIQAMRVAAHFMAEDGILFLGVPMGRDALVWNAHRIYGKIRLPLLLKGWIPLDVYTIYDTTDIFDQPAGSGLQHLMALKKTSNAHSGREELAMRLAHVRELMSLRHPGTRDGKALLQIIQAMM